MHFMERLSVEVQSRTCSDCATGSGLNRYQQAIEQWEYDLNAQVLNPLGMLAKFQTSASQRFGDTYKANPRCMHIEMLDQSWLAVALSPAERAVLKDEPTFWTSTADGQFQPDECFIKCPCCYALCGQVRNV